MTTQAATLDIAHLRSWIGRQDIATEPVTAELVRRFRATFDEEPGTPAAGEAAPRLLHWCLAQPAALTASLGADGHPARGGFLPPVPLPRRMWAGGSIVFAGDMAVGETVRRASTIEDVSVKEGRSGILCFVRVRHEIDADGRHVLAESQDLVYRGLDAGGRADPPAAPPSRADEGRHREEVDASAPMLFRYSALTFNGHRIHYDHPYVTGVEGYPGLVIHGPLQATWLLRFAASLRGTPPVRFSFRGLSPAFDDAPLFLNAQESGDGLKLWTARPGGPVAMSAEAQW